MNEIERSQSRLVLGGWRVGSITMAIVLIAFPIGLVLLFLPDQPGIIWAGAFAALICWSLALRSVLWERIAFDSKAGEVRFDQLRLLGRTRRSAPLNPVSRVEVESRSSSDNKRSVRRLVLVTGRDRTPFTQLFTSGWFDDDAALVNDWLEQAFGDRWREGATRFIDPDADSTDALAGVTRIRHPVTGFSIDIPDDWAISVRHDKSGPLEVFGIRLLQRLDRPGQPRPPGDGGDWNRLIATGREDAGLTLEIRDGPLTRTLEETLEDAWSKQWGMEVLQTRKSVDHGGMRGFYIARRIPEGGSTAIFGRVGKEAATRQVWLGADHLNVEIVGMARIDDWEMQQALDAMFASIRVPGDA